MVRLRMVATVLSLALAAALLVVAAPAQAASPGSAGIGDAYFPQDGNGGYDVLRYNIHDRYRLKSGRLTGWTRITARAEKDLKRFNLDLLLPVSKVRVNGAKARFAKPNKHELRVWPARTLRDGRTFTVKVTYAGKPGNIGYLGEKNWLASKKEVVAMNQPHMAPWWFPSNDHPRDRAKMRIHVTVPRGKQAIANGRLVRKSKRAKTTTWHWRADEPMVPYLAFFAAGEFSIQRGTTGGLPWLNAVSKQLTPRQQDLSFSLLRRTADVDHWLAGELTPYPFSITGGLVTKLKVDFALENQTRPTYPYLGDTGQATLVHEQAHQWFGDDLAINRWRDIWLNEGFATYLEERYAETHGGVSMEMWLNSAYNLRATKDSFWRTRIARPGANKIFSGAVYVRGAMTLAALRNRLGDDTFNDVVRGWLELRSGKTGSTEQFIELAEAVSGEDLSGFFNAWVFSGTKPPKTAQNGF